MHTPAPAVPASLASTAASPAFAAAVNVAANVEALDIRDDVDEQMIADMAETLRVGEKAVEAAVRLATAPHNRAIKEIHDWAGRYRGDLGLFKRARDAIGAKWSAWKAEQQRRAEAHAAAERARAAAAAEAAKSEAALWEDEPPPPATVPAPVVKRQVVGQVGAMHVTSLPPTFEVEDIEAVPRALLKLDEARAREWFRVLRDRGVADEHKIETGPEATVYRLGGLKVTVRRKPVTRSASLAAR